MSSFCTTFASKKTRYGQTAKQKSGTLALPHHRTRLRRNSHQPRQGDNSQNTGGAAQGTARGCHRGAGFGKTDLWHRAACQRAEARHTWRFHPGLQRWKNRGLGHTAGMLRTAPAAICHPRHLRIRQTEGTCSVGLRRKRDRDGNARRPLREGGVAHQQDEHQTCGQPADALGA